MGHEFTSGQTHNRSVLGNLDTINKESPVRYSNVAALQAQSVATSL